MPWKECSVVEVRLRFVTRLLDGEAMTELGREFGMSRRNLARASNEIRLLQQRHTCFA